MCTPECRKFAETALTTTEIHGHSVLEVGARDFNGSLRQLLVALEPESYVAVDMLPGPGVDIVCNAENLVQYFGRNSFDVVISTEMLEHVRDWRRVISNLKGVLRPGGILVLTTRSKGFPFHGYPGDFWRYEIDDFKNIFADTTIDMLQSDAASAPGVLLKARKPEAFTELDLADYRLYSIIRRRRRLRASGFDVLTMTVAATVWRAGKVLLPEPLINAIRRRLWHPDNLLPCSKQSP